MKDQFERNITYARISLTERCNLACKYCMPANGCKNAKEEMSDDEIESLVNALYELGIKKIRFTGGEPLVRKNVLDLFERICPKYNIEWAITTNATTLEKDAKRLLNAGIKHINISFDTYDRQDYKNITGFDMGKAERGLKTALSAGFEKIRVNAVLINEVSEKQIKQLSELTLNYNADVRFIELMPIGDCAEWSKKHMLYADEVLKIMPKLSPCEQEKHSPAKYYKLPNAKGRVGLITPISCNFCADCNRIRITSDAKIKPCLHSDREISFKDVIFDGERLKERILYAVNAKPEKHYLNENKFIARNMSQIGG